MDTVGGTLPIALAVKVTDALNNPVSGVTITWTVTGGGGSRERPDVSVQRFRPGPHELDAGHDGDPDRQHADAERHGRGLGSQLPGHGASRLGERRAVHGGRGARLHRCGRGASTITVTARDGFGNVIPGKAVVLVATGTGNALTQPAGNTGANGVATGSLTSTVAETKTVTATVGGVAVTQTAPFVVTAGAASTANSTVATSSGTVASGANVTLTLQAKDAAGNNLTSGGLLVAFTASGGTSTGTISSTTDNGNGTYTASFTGVAAGTATTIHATIGGGAVTSALPTVTVTPGAAATATSAVTVSSGTVASGSSVTLTLQAKDANGNNLTGGGLTVAFSASGGTSTGTIGTVVDSLNGRYVATFTGVTAGTATTIGATINTAAVTSTLPTVTVTAGTARQLVFTTEPAGASAGTPFGVVVTARDSVGNTATGFTGGVTVAITPGTGKAGAALRGSATVPAVSGVATFSGLSVDSVGTGYTLTASATGPRRRRQQRVRRHGGAGRRPGLHGAASGDRRGGRRHSA